MKVWALCVSGALCACAGSGEGLDENGRPEDDGGGDTLQSTFQSIQDNVFTPVCTGCHAGAAAPLGLRLDEGASYALLVNAPSAEVPALQRVQPGNPDASYLIQKLEGTADVGGRMPLNGPALPQSTIAVIRQWITDGAEDTPAASSGKSRFELAQLQSIAPIDGTTWPDSNREIVIASSIELDDSLLQSDLIALHASGGDGEFDAGNERAVSVAVAIRSRQPTVLVIAPTAAALPADTYELRISGGEPVALADYRGQLIDGDANGMPGGDFVVRFTVEVAR